MATRKAPTGAKHDRCIGHVEHPYPAKGMLCFGEVIGRDGMVEFADHLAKTRAEHRAADLARVEAMHLAARPGSVAPTAKRSTRRKRVSLLAGAYAQHSTGQSFSGPAAIRTSAADAAKLAELVARFRAMRGLPVEATVEPVAVSLARKAAANKPAAPVQVAPVVPETSVPTPTGMQDVCIDCGRVCNGGALTNAPVPAADACACAHSCLSWRGDDVCRVKAPCADGRRGHEHVFELGIVRPVVEPAPDTYAAAVEVAETRPDPCEECGHPAHGATCAVCDDAAQVGTYAPCSDNVRAAREVVAEPERHYAGLVGIARDLLAGPVAVPAPVEPVAEPAPVLSAPAPVTRPTCERCGQVFRLKGSGAEWHRINRPDCARVAVAF